MLQIVVSLLMIWLWHVYRIDQDFGVVHGAPTDETTMVAKRRELVFLDVPIDCLLDVEVAIRHYETVIII